MVDKEELSTIANADKNVYTVSSYSDLPALTEIIANATRSGNPYCYHRDIKEAIINRKLEKIR